MSCEHVQRWLEFMSRHHFIPTTKYVITPEQAEVIEKQFGYRYGFNRVVGPGDRGQYVGYFSPESVDHNFVDGRTFCAPNN